MEKEIPSSAPLITTPTNSCSNPLPPPNTCPGCSCTATKLTYYSCCFSPACNNCYSGFHFLECPSARRAKDISGFFSLNQTADHYACNRCEGVLAAAARAGGVGEFGFSCFQCKLELLCEGCWRDLHTGKFSTHSYTKWRRGEKCPSLTACPTHNKPRKFINQSLQLLCPQCPTPKKPLVPLPTSSSPWSPWSPTQIQTLCQCLLSKSLQNSNKWKQRKSQLETEFQKIHKIIEQRYQQNLNMLQQLQDLDMRVYRRVDKYVQGAIQEIGLDYGKLGVQEDAVGIRFALLGHGLSNCRAEVLANQQFNYKVGTIQTDKLELLLKAVTITKFKLRDDDKENQCGQSGQKPRNSSINQRPSINNLSASRRSLSKSVSKVQPLRTSALRDSTASISRSQNIASEICISRNTSLNSSVIIGQNKTQVVKPSTGISHPAGSSDKKYGICRQTSLLSAKIEDISPVLLNFDTKESTGSRINFADRKQELQDTSLGQFDSKPDKENDKENIEGRGKRKSDYFELRDRMRKTNVVNNRFSKR